MVLNYIWVGFFLVAFLVAVIRVLGYLFRDFFADALGIIFTEVDLHVFKDMVDASFSMATASVDLIIALIGVMVLWLGIMKVGEDGGAVNIIARIFGPFFNKLFPELPKNHKSIGAMMMNLSANMLGLDNAATPLGLKAMEDLQELNVEKEKASNAQIMFLVLNTSGLTVIPVSILAYRVAAESQMVSVIFLPILLATYFSTLAGLISVSIYQRINLFNKVVIAYIGTATACIAGLLWWFSTLNQDQITKVSSFGGNLIIFLIIISFLFLAFRKKIDVYNSFITGAKDGFNVAIKIIPYLVAMLVAIGVFRASGAMDIVIGGIKGLVSLVGFNTDFVDALPVAFMKPLSGSGARGAMLEIYNNPNFGPDSFAGLLSSVFQGSTETTFYTLAVYFGAVGITRTRYAVVCGLIADLTGIIAAILIAYLFFH
ncbi:nucleoside recognition domain-containing protein [Sunxiuqinia indica]|uniref:nucleoside recognition domain-containing protein n=1 Tax=Sunxiuqinia indica TaxID=2692584 RepID=UPI001357E5F7|nr:nucleoside recognition domain-containing protein [Sunxiuqinia indica]